MNNKIAQKTLVDFVSCLEEKYFLVYGTCLGALREKDFIGHDLDIDIGIMRKDFKLEYVNALIEKGFKLHNMFGMLECGLELSFKKDGIKIDLMLYYQTGYKIWNCLWDNGGRNGLNDMIVHSYDTKLFEIQELELGGELFYSLGLDYIKAVYGEAWKTSITPWNWRTDHLCHDYELKIKLISQYA